MSRIKSKTVRAAVNSKDVLEMFHGVLGTGDGAVNLKVVGPKILKIKKISERYVQLLNAFKNSTVFRLEGFAGEAEALWGHVAWVQENLEGGGPPHPRPPRGGGARRGEAELRRGLLSAKARPRPLLDRDHLQEPDAPPEVPGRPR